MDATPIGRDASRAEIERASNALLGHTTGEIAQTDVTDVDPVKVKGQFGELLEAYYGMELDNDPEPDFRKAELELKCKPLNISYNDYFYPKEPLSVGMIDYEEVAQTEHWRDIEKLQRKFLNLLIVWFVHDDGKRDDFPFVWWQIWSPSEELDEQIQAEYEAIRQQILDGEDLSQEEAGNDILQTCPKHNYDFANREPGSFVVSSGHPHLEKPERRSWRIPCRFLIKMLADSAGIDTVDYGRSEKVEREALWERARERAEDSAPIEAFLPDDTAPTQAELNDFSEK
ncbi:MutH/Sau3AI family endonuclease [Halorussus sp. MSC15.2]|uniref:MutH/Sau3AI family endonuclease n=1 Tax=Halorussus sp. MSC15.2 TaxID=2283638 RepID=UPI0013D1E27F|nr:MutH/Sau3AI family endonuclease [Halorussus sp. MSC15.2]NEU59210.1 hypothetical protein [Halorussus sp. MSC15.2]